MQDRNTITEMSTSQLICETLLARPNMNETFTVSEVMAMLPDERSRGTVSAAMCFLERRGVIQAVGKIPRKGRGGKCPHVYRWVEEQGINFHPRRLGLHPHRTVFNGPKTTKQLPMLGAAPVSAEPPPLWERLLEIAAELEARTRRSQPADLSGISTEDLAQELRRRQRG